MWLAIEDLYTYVKAQVLYEGVLTRKFSVSQAMGQGRSFAPFASIKFTSIAFCVSFETVVFQLLLTGFISPRLLMTSLHLHYIHFCRRS